MAKLPVSPTQWTEDRLVSPSLSPDDLIYFKPPFFFTYLDLDNYKDAHLWNLALLRNLWLDCSSSTRQFRVIWHPHFNPTRKSRVQYAVLLVQSFVLKTAVPQMSAKVQKQLKRQFPNQIFMEHKTYHPATPDGKEYAFSIPAPYFGPLAMLNVTIFNIYETLSTVPPSGPGKKHSYKFLLHSLNYFAGLRELFLYEVLHAHCHKTMCPTWQSQALREFVGRLADLSDEWALTQHDIGERIRFLGEGGTDKYEKELSTKHKYFTALSIILVKFYVLICILFIIRVDCHCQSLF